MFQDTVVMLLMGLKRNTSTILTGLKRNISTMMDFVIPIVLMWKVLQ